MRYTIPAFTLSLMISTAAFAETTQKSAIDALPKEGAVSLSGTVDKIVDKDTFILRDASGKTIDVHTAANLNLQPGAYVSVKGEKTSEIAGMGEEIKAATVNTTAHAKTTAKAETRGTVEKTMDKLASGTPRSAEETPYAMKNNKADLPDTSYDVDVNRDKNGDIHVSSERQPDLKRNEAGVPINNNPDSSVQHGTSAKANVKADVNSHVALGTIDSLPEKGNVELKGKVARVGGTDSFTLEDANGKTIKVETASKADVKAGDMVKVNGVMSDRLLGMGRQIESAKVMTLGSN